jgi:hypothetical protein
MDSSCPIALSYLPMFEYGCLDRVGMVCLAIMVIRATTQALAPQLFSTWRSRATSARALSPRTFSPLPGFPATDFYTQPPPALAIVKWNNKPRASPAVAIPDGGPSSPGCPPAVSGLSDLSQRWGRFFWPKKNPPRLTRVLQLKYPGLGRSGPDGGVFEPNAAIFGSTQNHFPDRAKSSGNGDGHNLDDSWRGDCHNDYAQNHCPRSRRRYACRTLFTAGFQSRLCPSHRGVFFIAQSKPAGFGRRVL